MDILKEDHKVVVFISYQNTHYSVLQMFLQQKSWIIDFTEKRMELPGMRCPEYIQR